MKEFLGLKGDLIDLTVEIKGKGQIQINSIIPKLVNGKWTGKYFTKIPINLKAISAPGHNFVEWMGYVESNQQNIEIIFLESQTVTAVFD